MRTFLIFHTIKKPHLNAALKGTDLTFKFDDQFNDKFYALDHESQQFSLLLFWHDLSDHL